MTTGLYEVNYTDQSGTTQLILISAPDVGTALDALATSLGSTPSVISCNRIKTIDLEASAQTLAAQVTGMGGKPQIAG